MRGDFPTCPSELTSAAFGPRGSAGPSGWGAPPPSSSRRLPSGSAASAAQPCPRAGQDTVRSADFSRAWVDGGAGGSRSMQPVVVAPFPSSFIWKIYELLLCTILALLPFRFSPLLRCPGRGARFVLFLTNNDLSSVCFKEFVTSTWVYTKKKRAALTRKCAAPGVARCVCVRALWKWWGASSLCQAVAEAQDCE